MHKIVSIVIIISFVVFQSCTNFKFEQNIKLEKDLVGFNRKVDSIVIDKMNQYNIPGLSIGIVQNDSIVYTKGYGVKKIGTKDSVSKNSIFHTASISKLFTAIAVMHLIDDGQLSLDDALIDILPTINFSDERAKKITIKNLLNHTSSLPDISNYKWRKNNQSDNTLKKYISGLQLKVSSSPSSEYRYSSLAYDILGYVVEKISNSAFEDYVEELILNPSGMNNSDFRYFKIPDSLKTTPHSKRWITKKIYPKNTYPYTREHSPSSTLNSSSKDLSNWMIYFLKNIHDKSCESIYNSMLEPSFEPFPGIGLGFQLYNFKSYKAVGHFGGDKGFRSFLMMIPEHKIGLVLLANCDYNEDFRQEILYPIANLMLTKPE